MSLLAPIRRHRVGQAASTGLLRSVRLFRLFLSEQADPDAFYSHLAEDAVGQVAEHGPLDGRTVVDVGGGGGWFTAAGHDPSRAPPGPPDRPAGRAPGSSFMSRLQVAG